MTCMNASRQVPPGERSGSDDEAEDPGDPIAIIEQALVSMRRDQERRRLQRRAERGEGGARGAGGWPGEGSPGGWRGGGGGGRGRRGRAGVPGEGSGDANDGSH